MKRTLSTLLLLLFFFSCELNPPSKGEVHHLGIALGYQKSGVQPLYAPYNDLACLKNALQLFYHPRPLTHTLFSDQSNHKGTLRATKQAIVDMLLLYATTLSKEDLLIITYSGHGLADGSWVLASEVEGQAIYTEKAGVDPAVLLTVDEIFASLSEIEAATLIVADSCYSGALLGSEQLNRDITVAYNRYFLPKKYQPEVFMLTSTTKNHTCSEPFGGIHTHGYFTDALLRSLGWDCTKKTLTRCSAPLGIDSLYQGILANQRIPTEAGISYAYQSPQISAGPLELLFSR